MDHLTIEINGIEVEIIDPNGEIELNEDLRKQVKNYLNDDVEKILVKENVWQAFQYAVGGAISLTATYVWSLYVTSKGRPIHPLEILVIFFGFFFIFSLITIVITNLIRKAVRRVVPQAG